MTRSKWWTVPVLCAGFLLTKAATAETPDTQPTEARPAQGAEVSRQAGAQGQAAAEEPAVSDSQAHAMAVLKRMAEFLAHAKQFSVNLRIGYDVVQDSGEKVEFGELRKVTVRRPDELRVELERSDGDKALLVFDGKDITAYKEAEHVYAVTPKPGDIDTAVEYLMQDLGVRMPLALMVVSRFPAVIERRVETADYVERSVVTAVPTDHVAARTAEVDFQVWVAEGDKPLPQRVVITYKTAKGQPQFWAQVSDWNLSPDVSKSVFAFTPPQGVERIPFLVRVRQEPGQPPSPGAAASPTSPGTPQATGSTGGEPK
jgi:hypothetical protein